MPIQATGSVLHDWNDGIAIELTAGDHTSSWLDWGPFESGNKPRTCYRGTVAA